MLHHTVVQDVKIIRPEPDGLISHSPPDRQGEIDHKFF